MAELLLGLDVGTTSARALICQPDGTVLATARQRLTTHHPGPGRAEQDLEAVWQAVLAVVASAVQAAGVQRSDLAALGIASQRTSIAVWDRADGRPLAPMVLWSDLRGAERNDQLLADGFISGLPSAVCKLEQVLAGVPERAALTSADRLCWGTLESFLAFRLSGGALHITDPSCAWPTLYLDFADPFAWQAPLLAHQGLDPACFPTLVPTFGDHGRTDPRVFGAAVPVAALVADQQAGMVRWQADSAGAWKLTLGTSAVLMVCTGDSMAMPGPAFPAFIQHADRSGVRWCTEGMVASAGSLFDWLGTTLGVLDDVADASAMAASVPDSGGVYLLPALSFLGAPYNNFAASARLVGLTAGTSRAQIVRAAVAAVACRVAEVAAVLRGPEVSWRVPDMLPVDGGAAVNDSLCQALADQLQVVLQRPAQVEGTAMGAALAAARGVGLTVPRVQPSGGRQFVPAWSADQAGQHLLRWQQALGHAVV